MSYMQEAEAWLDEVLKDLPEKQRQEPKRLIKAKLFESYRNGQESRDPSTKKWPTSARSAKSQ
jgi:hypothetical protein